MINTMIHKLLFAILALAPAVAHSQNSFLGIRGTYTDDASLERDLDFIIQAAERQVEMSPETDSIIGHGAMPQEVESIWWEKDAGGRLFSGNAKTITLEDLFVQALQYSTQIKVFSDIPLIRETAIQEAEGMFDIHAFVESVYDRTNDPITSLLETGAETGRFTQNEFRNEIGLRKRMATGADITLGQEFGYLDNNSSFLVPNPQSVSRLRLAIVQPLLRGAGLAYNRAIIDIAKLDTDAAYQEQIRQAESHLLEITRAYWTLHFARVSYVRKVRYYEQAKGIADELEARTDIDALEGQLTRARSAVAFRRSELVRAQMEISNAQDRIRTLVNSPDLGVLGSTELIPSDEVLSRRYPVNYRLAARRALSQRPEIQQGILQIRAAAVRERMSRNEVLPQLNLILEAYVAGVDNNRDMAGAWANQYNQGSPGVLAGLSLEWPFANNTARARRERRQIELRQNFNQLQTGIDTVLLEVRASVREVQTAWKDYVAKLESVRAAEADLKQFAARRDVDTADAGELRSQSWYLDEWLNAQSRLEFAEQEFARVATIYQVAIMNLERAQGNLLKAESIEIVRTEAPNGLPLLELHKTAPTSGFDPKSGGFRR